jgi:hypothetical protein
MRDGSDSVHSKFVDDVGFKNSWIFKNLKIFQLTIPIRDGSDSVHSKFVDDVGNGVLNNLKQNCEISLITSQKFTPLIKQFNFVFQIWRIQEKISTLQY